jgi:hypothetical protein
MKPCGKCEQQNAEEALFCLQCGAPFAAASEAEASPQPLEEEQLWRAFIGRNADRYLGQFRKFTRGPTPRFALTWHWPSFLFDPFLWFLYRKLYLYAVVYAIGPVLSAYLTGDMTVGIVWRVMAGLSANYVYYWHVRDHVSKMGGKAVFDPAAQERALRELGGVQPYVIWVGVVLHILLLGLIISAIRDGPPEGGTFKRDRLQPASTRTLPRIPS